jgi:hypothetical protein
VPPPDLLTQARLQLRGVDPTGLKDRTGLLGHGDAVENCRTEDAVGRRMLSLVFHQVSSSLVKCVHWPGAKLATVTLGLTLLL